MLSYLLPVLAFTLGILLADTVRCLNIRLHWRQLSVLLEAVILIPAKLRDDLGDSFVICNGLEGCLFVYSQEEWNKFVAELETLPRMSKDARIFKRYFFGSASEGSFDKQGRVLVPPSLRKAAGLEKDVDKCIFAKIERYGKEE